MLRNVSSLEELERRAALLELTTDLVSSVRPDGTVAYLNAAGFALMGWPLDTDISTKRVPDFHPRWATKLIIEQGLPVAMRDGVWRGKTALLGADGQEIPVSQVIVAHREPGGEVPLLSTIIRDIREHLRIEEELRGSTQMLQLVMDYVPQFVFWKDRNSAYRGCNRNFAKLAGLEHVEDIVGKTDLELGWAQADGERLHRLDTEVMQRNEPQTHVVETRRQTDGSQCLIDSSRIPLHDEASEVVGILGMFEDITARTRAEEQLHQSQKLESLGELAGGVAHDFNNMLTVIRGAAELLALEQANHAGVVALAEEILDATDKAAGLTQKLLDVSRKGTSSRECVDLHAIIHAAKAQLERNLDGRIRVHVQLDATQFSLFGDPTQLQSVIVNLGLNAREAMPNGGELRISTADVDIAADDVRRASFVMIPGPHVELVVRDTGVGMTPAVAQRVFEPYFTTKALGSGSGLGLAAVYSAIVDHRGAIEFDTEAGVGTSFRVWLPVDPQATGRGGPSSRTLARASGRILLVDDEELVRNVAARMLRSLGYEVVMAEDGVRALEVYQAERERIDLVILDMLMPQLDGRQTLQALRGLPSDVPVLFCSGYTRERVDVGGEGVRGFIKKPYSKSELERQVAEALGRARPGSGS